MLPCATIACAQNQLPAHRDPPRCAGSSFCARAGGGHEHQESQVQECTSTRRVPRPALPKQGSGFCGGVYGSGADADSAARTASATAAVPRFTASSSALSAVPVPVPGPVAAAVASSWATAACDEDQMEFGVSCAPASRGCSNVSVHACAVCNTGGRGVGSWGQGNETPGARDPRRSCACTDDPRRRSVRSVCCCTDSQHVSTRRRCRALPTSALSTGPPFAAVGGVDRPTQGPRRAHATLSFLTLPFT